PHRSLDRVHWHAATSCAARYRPGSTTVAQATTVASRCGRRYPSGMPTDEAAKAKERIAYLTDRLAAERRELTELERDAVRKAALHQTIASHVDEEMARTATRGQRVADAVARVGGSWPFVIGFCGFLLIW